MKSFNLFGGIMMVFSAGMVIAFALAGMGY